MKRLIVTLALVLLAGCADPKKSDMSPKDQEIARLRAENAKLREEIKLKQKYIAMKFDSITEYLSTDMGYENIMVWAHDSITGKNRELSHGDSAKEVCEDISGGEGDANEADLPLNVRLACNIVLNNEDW